ncbi:2-hydroxyacid dehydrogenase [Pseudonocardia asaccharolytica]|uniref:D-glycerate dehydrogenase n=1 Tax=Pseudonocardia asaccharolytica DSM 44247 = NBRC 16224 TaxID=1123024 RepID=A0A511D870_9PSEU|nr:D-glycerate dehydrogenase [Pseudonocardia asaccharolytica]GEL20817.1 D-glycerate dehydrogenase [Pseudonocardia asaccharolytica DSM 44247 = NBRC 16224]
MDEPVIVVTRRWPGPVERELLRRYPGAHLNSQDAPLGFDGLRTALLEADVVLPTVTDRLPAEIFDGELRARFLGNFGVGFNHIDTVAAAKAGIVVTNTPGVLTAATADTAMTLLLMAARRAGEGEREVRAGAWTGWRPTHLLGTDVTGKTIGILGMGRIGTALARRAHFGFDMPVVYYDGSEHADSHGIPGARRAASVEEVLEVADFVSLHMPGSDENTHLIDAARLARMKPTAFLINTARGDIVDHAALVEALRAGTIAGCGLDVFEREPTIPDGLLELDNVVALPHLGSATMETRTAMGMLVLDNLAAYLAGREPSCRVV